MRVAILRRTPQASFSMDVYANSLLKGLRVVRPDWKFIEYAPNCEDISYGQTNWMNGIQKYYERYWQYPRDLSKFDADIFHIIDHSDGYLSYWLKLYKKPNVVTCHDLINLIKPETFKGRARFPLISMTAWRLAIQGMRKAEHIIAVSSHTKKDVLQYLKINSSEISVIPNAVDSIFKPISIENIRTFRHQQRLSEQTFCLLNVGSNNARKNISTVLDVISVLKAQGFPVYFWKVGADFNAEQKNLIESRGLKACVTYLGNPNKETLVKIYNAADLLLAPSLYEGFGLTILEAMASGTVVITANVTALPEVAGDAGILVDPLDVETIVTVVRQLHSNPVYRQELIQKGLERVKKFTWEKTAEQVANIYEKVIYSVAR